MSEVKRELPPVWASFERRAAGEPWRLGGISVLSAEGARAHIEREHARGCVRDAAIVVRAYASTQAVPWVLDAADGTVGGGEGAAGRANGGCEVMEGDFRGEGPIFGAGRGVRTGGTIALDRYPNT